ncbi:pyrimidine-nucleoside phosphorylase [Streptococcus ferus]|uniref:Pyrimidine-nucleoside phosphorylase n=2 Tax=Streptococcus ferus TaxID=1345 RepID=A0A2X3VYU3_9STRE|nr:pyrimidine-nucleoside phosphorylase [Streptococcus ferus]
MSLEVKKMRAVDLIQKKRDGLTLSTQEINWLIEGYAKGTVPDYQMSALAMAIYFKGMSTQETHDLTMAMVASGDQIDLSPIQGIKTDKHSTGGVGDKVTLILVPLVASFGVPVAKMSGRGLGHTGGTLDKLESIKGYQIERRQADFIKQVQEIGLSVIGQSDNLVKADKLLYALRDVTATVDIIPLIASSVMSKKIAAGADRILLDVTVGDGAFMKTLDDAEKLSRTMVALGREVDRQTIAVMTNMSQPLGQAIGNRLEVLEAVQIMQGQGRQDITDFICELAQIMLELADVEKSIKEIHEHLVNGQALQKFEEMVAYQGGDIEDIYRPSSAQFVTDIYAETSGYIAELPALEFGLFAMRLGAGRAVKTDALDYETGIVFAKKVGDSIAAGELVAQVYSNQILSEKMITDFKKNVKISKEQMRQNEILKIIR